MQSLCILLPITSQGQRRSAELCLSGLQALGQSLTPKDVQGSALGPSLSVCVGIDDDDAILMHMRVGIEHSFPAGVAVHTVVFTAAEKPAHADGETPICWMWNRLAAAAVSVLGAEWTMLLGDDVEVRPAGWPSMLAGAIALQPALKCMALLDAADPGFPSFLAIESTHMKLFGRMLPGEFVNQGGDPYLFELYRSIGAADVCASVTIRNTIGGMERTIFQEGRRFAQPRYERRSVSPMQFAKLLGDGKAQVLQKSRQARLQIAVLVPSFRADPAALATILDAAVCTHLDVDIRVIIQLDNPCIREDARAWLQQQQHARLHRLRVRWNSANKGAAKARNQLLDEAAGCDYVVFFDDDVCPQPGCLDAYVEAFKQHPEEAGYVGPTILPRQPHRLLPTSIHMSDISFFWEAPVTLASPESPYVPWAVTANVAFKNTSCRFRAGFPKTGGGEDVDFCVLLGAKLRAVPGASAVHPWWPDGRPKIYMHFFSWAVGDGRLIELWPELAYWRFPNAAELCLGMMMIGIARILPAMAAVTGVLAIFLADAGLDILRNTLIPSRRRTQPCGPLIRPLAAAESCLIKAFSEAGRLWGHLRHGYLQGVCRNFDWFCGLHPGIVRSEQRRSALRALVCLAVAALAIAG